MAVNQTTIEAVRVWGADGIGVEYPWNTETCYLIRDDYPHLDILTRGHAAKPNRDAELSKLTEPSEDGTQWQRWDLSKELSRKRRHGEVSVLLKVPKGVRLRCYVIPTALLSYRDVITMTEDIEAELGFAIAWDMLDDRPERTWSRSLGGPRPSVPNEFMSLVEEEVRAATLIRRNPFTELGPRSRLDASLAENAVVSHWATRRLVQLRDLTELLVEEHGTMKARSGRNNPEKRQSRFNAELERLGLMISDLVELSTVLARFVRDIEIATPIYPSPLLQRDHRLRLLLRAFAPNDSETISDIESERSHYPPIFLNHLWELWGLVWIAQRLRCLGFSGSCSIEGIEAVKRCSWRLTRDELVIEMDFEAEPVFVDYDQIPPVHERGVPALEWAAQNQQLDVERPFLGLEIKCSPDYLVRITTPTEKTLLVGDACLASSQHHGKKEGKADSKPYTVERYRRTIGWAVEDQIIRCHPLGGFVMFPSPSNNWADFEKLPGASDCMLLCPSPQDDYQATQRLEALLKTVVPELGFMDLVGSRTERN